LKAIKLCRRKGPHHACRQPVYGRDRDRHDRRILGYAVRVEEDAAVHYDELAAEMEACGNQDVAKLFRQLASFSRLHLAEAKSRAGSIDVTKHLPPIMSGPITRRPSAYPCGQPIIRRS